VKLSALLRRTEAQVAQQARMLEVKQEEIEHLSRENRELAHAAKYDRKTGCVRRDYIAEMVNEKLKGRRASDSPKCAVAYVDIDNFKPVNDEHSHAFGDFVLRTIADIMRHSLRHDDLVARGDSGDEFIVFINHTTLARAERIMEEIAKKIAAYEFHPFSGGDPLQITVSYGVAERSDSASTLEQLADLADKAMYARRHATRRRS
jgi:diguanylate cyclase (GGDEF)-like protein